jgi:hypothetical protein
MFADLSEQFSRLGLNIYLVLDLVTSYKQSTSPVQQRSLALLQLDWVNGVIAAISRIGLRPMNAYIETLTLNSGI